MAKDYEDLFDLDTLDDDEIYEVIMQEIDDDPELDPDDFDIQVEEGFITLNGRVGTEQELQRIDHLVTDVLGVSNYSNEVVVGELARAQQSEAADDAAADAEGAPDPTLGVSGEETTPTADHLLEDAEGDAYGTRDMKKAIERGQAYTPPERPPQEGSWSEENH